jgi:hypothetical protein
VELPVPLSLKVETTDHKPAEPRQQEMLDQLVRDGADNPRQALLCLLRVTTQLDLKNEQFASLISAGFVRKGLQRLYDACP